MHNKIIVAGLVIFSMVGFIQGSWFQQNNGTNLLFDIDFPRDNIQTGFACGENSYLIKTTTGGSSWTPMHPQPSGNLNALIFPTDEMNGYIACNSGNVQVTTDGGENWTLINVGTSNNLYGIHFPDAPNLGYVVGVAGVIKKTLDNGLNWEDVSVYPIDLFDVYFRNEQTGWVVGDSGLIFFTEDGGMNWQVQNSNVTNRLLGLYFIDELSGWVVGAAKTCLKTTDGGQAWDTFDIPVPANTDLYSITFVDAYHGFICGTSGKIVRTVDGGVTWLESANLPDNFYRIAFPAGPMVGWVCGQNEAIYKTEDGGWIEEVNSNRVSNQKFIYALPNPFRNSTSIHAMNNLSNNTALKIFDCSGNLINMLSFNRNRIVKWDGRNRNHLHIAPGVYLIELKESYGPTHRLKIVKSD